LYVTTIDAQSSCLAFIGEKLIIGTNKGSLELFNSQSLVKETVIPAYAQSAVTKITVSEN